MEKLIRSDLRSGLRKLDRKKQKQVLATPNAIIEQKAARIANYELAKAEFSQWEGIVKRNRLADHLVFPEPPTHRVTMPESNEERKIRGDVFVKNALEKAKEGSQELDSKIFTTLYPGEASEKFIKKTSAMVKESDEFVPPDKQSLQDRLAERRIVKVKQGLLEAKLRQRAKIRSKNYHRHLKRQKVAAEARNLGDMASADPEALKEKVEMVVKRRIEERMTQRHRQGGLWARQMKAFQKLSQSGKSDVNDMQELAQQLLRKTVNEKEEEEDKDDEKEEKMEVSGPSKQRLKPMEDGWTMVLKGRGGDEPPNPMFEGLWDQARQGLPGNVNRKLGPQTPYSLPQDVRNPEMEVAPDPAQQEEKGLTLSLHRKTTMEDFDAMETEHGVPESAPLPRQNRGVAERLGDGDSPAPVKGLKVSLGGQSAVARPSVASLDPSVLDPLPTAGEGLEAVLDEFMGGDQGHEVEEDFDAEKAAIAKEEQPADLDTFLPGWNSWTGPGVDSKAQEKKRKKFVVRAPTVARSDAAKRRLIIRERRTGKAYRRHQVREIPFPYETAEQWEASTKHPIGRLWNTQATHRDLIRPRVAVKMGQIIGPLSRDVLYQRAEKKEKKKSIRQGERKKGQVKDSRKEHETVAGRGKQKRRGTVKRK